MRCQQKLIALSALSTLMMGHFLTGCTAEHRTPTSQMPGPEKYGAPPQPLGPQPLAEKPVPQLTPEQKTVLLSGAAALYYMYNQNKEMRAKGDKTPQYFLSANGHVYYRGPNGTVHWVSAPADGIRVPAAVAYAYRNFQGYEGRTTGRSLAGLTDRDKVF